MRLPARLDLTENEESYERAVAEVSVEDPTEGDGEAVLKANEVKTGRATGKRREGVSVPADGVRRTYVLGGDSPVGPGGG